MKEWIYPLNRREFIKQSARLTAVSGLTLSGAAYAIPVTSQHPNNQLSINIVPQKKALVFIMLDGGNDSYNMLVPISDDHYENYLSSRGNLALERNNLIPLPGFRDPNGRVFGLHPNMHEVAQLFGEEQLSFVANIGPMVEPVSKARFYDGARLPIGLLSHADQFTHWLTSQSHQRINRGWFGSFADALQQNRSETQVPMNISLSGNNILQNGLYSSHYTITEKGSIGLVIKDGNNALDLALLNSFENLLYSDYEKDPFSQTYLAQTRDAQTLHDHYRAATENITVPGIFSNTAISQQLQKVVQSIASMDRLNHQQQTYFLRYIGWDHHDELLNNHANMLSVLSVALGEFQKALDEMGLTERVITFTGSDFGRTLTSNGNGTDHGWGGNTIVMGGPINGGQIFGQYPDLTLDKSNPSIIGDGILIPTTPTDVLFAELAQWFGVAQNDLIKIFPNLTQFTNADCLPLGVVE